MPKFFGTGIPCDSPLAAFSKPYYNRGAGKSCKEKKENCRMLINVIQSLSDGQGVDWGQALAQVLSVGFVVLCVLPLHEFAHGWVACKLGDPTAKNAGRLTLNPFKSLDPLGAVAILLVGFGWAKPVPVNPRYFKNPKEAWPLQPWQALFPTCWQRF